MMSNSCSLRVSKFRDGWVQTELSGHGICSISARVFSCYSVISALALTFVEVNAEVWRR